MKELPNFEDGTTKENYSEDAFYSFLYSITSFLLLLSATLLGLNKILPYTFSDGLFASLGILALVFCIKGFIKAIKSIQHKEKNNYKKIIGLLGNILIILLFLYGIILIL